MTIAPRMTTNDWLTLVLLSVLWGGSFLFYKVLATQLPALTTVTARCVIAATALAGLFAAIGQSIHLPRRTWRQFLVLGMLNNAIPFMALAWGETRVASGTASILNAMTPVATLLVSAFVFRAEILTPARLAGVALGFAGVTVVVGPDALQGQDVVGQLVCLVAPLSYAFGVPYGRRIIGLAPPQMAVGQLVASSLILTPICVVFDRPWSLAAPDAAGWASLLGLALLSTAVAYVLFFRILARAGATNLTLVTFLVPISALLFGGALLGETVQAEALAGMALIVVGLAAIDGRALAWLRRRTAR